MHRICYVILLLLLQAQVALASMMFDFEQPVFVETPPAICKDHALLKVDGTYHIFYIHSLQPPPGWQLRSEFWLGHLTSPDLRNWTRQESILPVSEVPNSWQDGFIWAPKVIENPHGPGWILFYTGVEFPSISQQTGVAFSTDLFDWNRYLLPIYRPGEWSNWVEGSWADCRDPEIFVDEESYYLLNTAATAENQGAISLAASDDMLTWEDVGPLIVNVNSNVYESPQLVHAGGRYHLFFTEQWVGHTAHLSSVDMIAGWDIEDRAIIDIGAAPEISDLGDEVIFSRHASATSIQGNYYFYRFDRIEFPEGSDRPEISELPAMSDGWTQTLGSAFDNQPTFGDNPVERGQQSSNLEGHGYVSTVEDYSYPLDGAPGSVQYYSAYGLVRSTPFTIGETRLSLLVGGGDRLDRTFVGMVDAASGRMLFMSAGHDSYAMDRRLWNTESLIGEEVFLVIADLDVDGWGFISVDSIEEYSEAGDDSLPLLAPMVDGPTLSELIHASGLAVGVPDEAPAAARAGRLLAPFPNPFNPRTRLRYEIEAPGRVELRIVDASGRLVRSLDAGERQPGPGFFTWMGLDDRGQPMASGVYLATLQLGGAPVESRRLVLLR